LNSGNQIASNTMKIIVFSGEKMGKKVLIIGLIVFLIGLLLALSASSMISLNLNLGMQSNTQLIAGAVLVIIGLLIMVKGRK
jgi:hypothetical protein